MKQLAADLRAEGDQLYGVLETLSEADWARNTPFKNWTVNDVMGHLHLGDWMVVLTMTDADKYLEVRDARKKARDGGVGMNESMAGLGPDIQQGPALLAQWRDHFLKMCDAFATADPKHRVKWSGPDMGVRMAATARQMETWAHGQEVYDLQRQPREVLDRLKNIAVLGVKTFGWTFANRGLTPPGAAPYVQVGDRVNEGDTLCIIEAMKMMNQIEADKAGTIGAILLEDGEPVEFDQPMFTIV